MRLQFQDFTFDAETRQLFRSGEAVHLTPKAFRLLEILLENRPKVVSKESLLESLWPNTHVSDGNLTTVISEVRRAFSDHAPDVKPIRTVHKFGYAFCGDVSVVPSAAPVTSSSCQLVWSSGSHVLVDGENWIGRDGATISLDSPTVSRRHAKVIVRMGAATVEDLGSKNGTFVNGDCVRKTVLLTNGDEIRLGAVKLFFRILRGADTATFGG